MKQIEPSKTEKHVSGWLWAIVIGFSILFLAGMASHVSFTPSKKSVSDSNTPQTIAPTQKAPSQPANKTTDHAMSPTSDPQAAIDPTPLSELPPNATCYEASKRREWPNATPDSRKAYAERITNLWSQNPGLDIESETTGNDNQTLVIFTSHSYSLLQTLYNDLIVHPHHQDELCSYGFDREIFMAPDEEWSSRSPKVFYIFKTHLWNGAKNPSR